jgi:anti-sigma-K factor RskA
MSAGDREDTPRPDPDVLRRVDDLLADSAMQGLSVEDERELEHLLAQAGGIDAESFDRAAAALDLALGPQTFEPMPAALASRIATGTMQSTQIRSARHSAIVETARGARGEPLRAPRSLFIAWSGWIAAAAAIVVAFFLARPSSTTTSTTPPAVKTAALVREVGAAKDHASARWKDPAGGTKVQGNVDWSNELQKGYVRLAGLPKNDPSKEQYQLWIFDKNQDEKTPIDGGVFDIASDPAIVPIDAKLHVTGPTMFAVTVEKPGGVVVSKREKLVALARL